jgi:phosphatidylserine decarboxylase
METLKEFLKRPDIKRIRESDAQERYSVQFNRAPNRPIYTDPSCFYSPADGFIIYSAVVKPDEDIIKIKGVNYTVNGLLAEEIKEPCMVIGIFMTNLDVHVNRMPTDGFVWYEKMDAMKVNNLSMREVEKEILDGLKVDYSQMQYALYNERVKNRVYCHHIQQHYWLVQIADYEVDVICPYGDNGDFFTQGECFSKVMMGSQVDVIVPLKNKSLKFESLVHDNIGDHIEAGIDPIIQWDWRKK